MPAKKVIAVVGSTGAQGGALVRAILDDGELVARAITRDASSQKAQELKKLGADVVEADMNDPDSLAKAIQGAYGMFCVTFYWDHFDPEKEMLQAKSMADAARKASVKHVVWSTVEDTRLLIPADSKDFPAFGGRYKVPHCDAKGEADKFFKDLPTTYLLTCLYWENFANWPLLRPQKSDDDGKYYLTAPLSLTTKLPSISSEDIGKCALGIFKRPQLIGQRIGIAGEHVTYPQFAAKMSTALQVEINYKQLSYEAYRQIPVPGVSDIANMFRYMEQFQEHFQAARNVDKSRSLNGDLMNFDQWLAKNKNRILVE